MNAKQVVVGFGLRAMSNRYTRQQLYDLVWAEPMQSLAKKFGLSDVGLSKACRRASIPVPERGYWNRLHAGQSVARKALPPRPLGTRDQVEIGSLRDSPHSVSEESIINETLTPPVFHESIEDITASVARKVRKVRCSKSLENAHPKISRLLKADEAHRQKQADSIYPMPWDAPIFDSPFERRRLRIINSLFVELIKHGGSPMVSGREGRELSVLVGDVQVYFALDHPSRMDKQGLDYRHETKALVDGRLKLAISYWWDRAAVAPSWEDGPETKIENFLTEIVVQLLAASEVALRYHDEDEYRLKVERKARLTEEIRQRNERKVREERERLERIEKERVETLRQDVAAWREASEIRTYVDAVMRANVGPDGCSEALRQWEAWALATAAQLDPLSKPI